MIYTTCFHASSAGLHSTHDATARLVSAVGKPAQESGHPQVTYISIWSTGGPSPGCAEQQCDAVVESVARARGRLGGTAITSI